MYLYIAFLDQNGISKGNYYMGGKYFENFRNIFPHYDELNQSNIEGCIGFLKSKGNGDQKCFTLKLNNINIGRDFLSFDFIAIGELDIPSDLINRSLYKFAIQSGWINKSNKYYPNICIFNKVDFDTIRKGMANTRKISNNTAKIEEYRIASNWSEICNIFEPLEKISTADDIWNNAADLYSLAFACSKLGEPKNGMEKDKNHLAWIKRYRDLSIAFYKRCCELEPDNFRYPASLAYRYYQNVMELSKPKGRRDGKIAEEISQGISYFDIALKLNPNSIKDNYRKGKLISKQIANYKYKQREWSRETFLEIEKMEKGLKACMERAIESYENIADEENQKRYKKEYVKALYCIGCYYSEKTKLPWNEYACCKLQNIKFDLNLNKQDMDNIAKARLNFEKCFKAETGISLEDDFDSTNILAEAEGWAISPIDKLYRLGLIYLEMYFIKKNINIDDLNTDIYRQKAFKYLNLAKCIGDEWRRKRLSGRNTCFISEKLAWYYILCEDFKSAVSIAKGILERSHDSYIINTYAIALALSDISDKYNKAKILLYDELLNANNKASDTTIALIAHIHKLCKEDQELEMFLLRKKDQLRSSGKRLIALL